MNWPRTISAGLKAAALGSLIGTSLISIVALIAGLSSLDEDIGGAILIVIFPFLVGFVCSLSGLVTVGLPLTMWLRRRKRESRGAYLSGGIIGGGVAAFLVGSLLMDPFTGIFLAAFGVLTGGTTGIFWWRYARQYEVDGGLEPLVEVFK